MLKDIYKTQFIKNLSVALCNECVYFKQKTSTCSKFGTRNVVSGEITEVSAKICRTNETQCGIDAKYFIKRDSAYFVYPYDKYDLIRK